VSLGTHQKTVPDWLRAEIIPRKLDLWDEFQSRNFPAFIFSQITPIFERIDKA